MLPLKEIIHRQGDEDHGQHDSDAKNLFLDASLRSVGTAILTERRT